jgi:vacuolar-type H+-ATPase subunit F/Vma7
MILSGALISLGVFLTYGLSKNMFGGIEFRPEGIIMSLIILFFTLLFGMVFKRTIPSENTAPSLTDKEAALVRNALDEDDADNTKVIIVKQDDAEKGSEETNEWDYQNYNPYMYAYPPEYYDDENYDYDDYEE